MRALVLASMVGITPIQAFAQERIQGKVVSTELTHCDFKPGSCAGNLTLERAGQATNPLTVEVPLGTTIRSGSEHVYLPALKGRTVSIDLITTNGQKAVSSIDVVEASATK